MVQANCCICQRLIRHPALHAAEQSLSNLAHREPLPRLIPTEFMYNYGVPKGTPPYSVFTGILANNDNSVIFQSVRPQGTNRHCKQTISKR